MSKEPTCYIDTLVKARSRLAITLSWLVLTEITYLLYYGHL